MAMSSLVGKLKDITGRMRGSGAALPKWSRRSGKFIDPTKSPQELAIEQRMREMKAYNRVTYGVAAAGIFATVYLVADFVGVVIREKPRPDVHALPEKPRPDVHALPEKPRE